MTNYFERFNTPPANRLLIAYCKEWSAGGYQICMYGESGFYYEEQPNDCFDIFVTHWALLLEID